MSEKAASQHDEARAQESVEELPSHTRVSFKTLLLLLSVNLIYFSQLVNIVGSGVLTRSIIAVVGGNSTNGAWFTQTIAILTAVLGIPVSQGADLWGRKVFLVGLTAFGAIGSIIVARAKNIDMALAGFAITGISYGAQPLLLAVTSEVLARKHRPWAQASINIASALGAITGLLVGGAWTKNNPENFRNYWYLTAGIYTLTVVVCQLLYNPPPRPLQLQLTAREKIGRLDWAGYALLTPALTLVCMALTWSQNPYGWTDPHVLASFLVGISLAIALLIYEIYGVRDGMFHHDLFHHRNFPIALVCIFSEGLIFFSGNNYFPFQVSLLFGTNNFLTGLHFAVTFVSFIIFCLAAGYWCSKARAVRIPSAVAFASFMLFCILMATVSLSKTKVAGLWVFPIFLGAGLGICLTALVTAAHFATPHELVAITSGLLISVRNLGGSIGLALFNAIFSNDLSKIGTNIAHAVVPLGFPESGLPMLIPALVNHDTEALAKIPEASQKILAAGIGGLEETYLAGFRHVWISASCFCFVAMIGCLFLENPTEEFTSQVDAPINHVQRTEKGAFV